MTIERVPEIHYPKADIGRRGMALGLDFLGVWLISSILGGNQIGIQWVQILVFLFCWAIFRILVVYNNQGQSLGRWAFDLKILEVRNGEITGRVPTLRSLLKREAIIGFGALLVSIALSNIRANPTAIMLLIPLAIDCGAALSDNQMQQALHDRYGKTFIVSSRRGYSLDIKIKRLVGKMLRSVRR
ncbi:MULTISPECIES: RDD family protein [unclassified Nodularia (in: cyanobacteria)]|uniref:RDD family protein n=1 Tax=unclassified Nodularia (in: cyanobacteria) TaxID=2656917 RepID=UPI001880F644|nr:MULTISPECIES: RDD family protein [unclassified Nodularia (in: cyanobacteria)]MBE9197666.1 RDD family protein [Nodularia sp. LEGE 06071]MCC2694040.1 RDD family protein [Nodularia sp. LEGE 04288]